MLRRSHPPIILSLSLLRSLAESGSRKLFVGNSGDFYLDRSAAKMGFKVHSSDPTVLGRCIAALTLNEQIEIKCNDEELEFLVSQWPEHRFKPLVQILFGLNIGEFVARKNDYQMAKYREGIAEALPFFQKTIGFLEKKSYFDFNIAPFQHGYFVDHFFQAPEDAHCLLNLLTESITKTSVFRFVEKTFSLGDSFPLSKIKSLPQTCLELFQSKSMSVFSDKPLEGMEIYLKGKATQTNGRKPIFLYSNLENLRPIYSVKNQTGKTQDIPRTIPPDYVFPEDACVSVVKCKPSMVFHYKHLFMSSRVDYSDAAELALAFLVDGMIFGFASFSQWTTSLDGNRYIFLNSDFVLPSQMPRLSKLLLHLLVSDEVRRFVSRQYLFSYPAIQTTVFTDKPVSMKYRGVFQKVGNNTNGKLTYTANFTTETLNERFERWKKQSMTGQSRNALKESTN